MNYRFGGGKMTEYGFSSYILMKRVMVIRERTVWRKKCHKLEEKKEDIKFIVMSEKVNILED